MFNSPKDILGLAISSGKIFVSHFNLRAGVVEAVQTVSASLSAGIVERGYIIDTDAFSQTLKGLLAKNNIKTRVVFAAVSGGDAVTRAISKKEIDKYPFADKESIWGAFVLNDEAMAVALKRDAVNSLLAAVKKSGLELTGVDTAQLAALRALIGKGVGVSSKKAAMVVFEGPEKSDIIVAKDSRPFYMRSVETTSIDELAKEIKITVEFWEENSSLAPIEKIIVLRDKPDLNPDLAGFGDAIFQKESFIESASLGAGMRLAKVSLPFDINLLPPEKFRRMAFEKKVLKIFTIFSLVLFAFFILSGVLTMVLKTNVKKLVPIEKELEALPDILSKVEGLNTERAGLISELGAKKNFFDSLKTVPWTDVLKDIKDKIPPQVWLTEITSSGNSLSMNGKAYSQEAVYDYVRLLEYSLCIYGTKPTMLEREEAEGEKSIFLFKISAFLTPEGEG